MPNKFININCPQFFDWGNGFQEKILITNNNDSNEVDSGLEFDLSNEIFKIWDAKRVENDKRNYIIKRLG